MPRVKKSEEQDSADRNLAAIKRIDPFADSLVDTSPHVSLYDFDQEGSKWDKTGVEGPLFIYHRIDKPLHSIMIANRQSPNDFFQPLHTDVKLRHQSPYVYMYKKSGAIKALSFMGEDECKRIFEVLCQLCQQQKDPEKNEVPFQASLNTLVYHSSANSKIVDEMASVFIAAKPVDVLDQKVEPQKVQPSSSSAIDIKVKKPRARKPKQRDDLNKI
uniref:Uncharacterized protein n=1 Tax=Ditylenchus dipsaci TaxID=166011 RepID=A0A915EVH9_9BILA